MTKSTGSQNSCTCRRCCCSVAKSFRTLRPHGLKHARIPCPSLSPGVCSDSCALSWRCYLTISSSAAPFSFYRQSFPESGSFPGSQFFASGGQSIGVSAQHQSNEYSELISFRIDWLDLLAVQGTLESLLQHHNSKASVLQHSASFQLSHPYMTTGKTIALTRWTFVGKLMSLLFNMLFRFVLAFLPRNKCLLISWLRLQSTVILEPKKIKSVTALTFSPSICHGMMGSDLMSSGFFNAELQASFFTLLFHPHQEALSSPSHPAIGGASSAYLRLLLFLPAMLIPACDSSSLAFHMMFYAYKFDKQGDNIQPCRTPFLGIITQANTKCV